MSYFYTPPKKIELSASLAKWSIQAEQCVLVVFGFQRLAEYSNDQHQELLIHLNRLIKKAQALDIEVIEIEEQQSFSKVAQLGELLAEKKQLIVSGMINSPIKQLLQHIISITPQICVVNDAVHVETKSQHLQWIENCVEQGIHHMNTSAMIRMLELSAPTSFILSEKGILLSIAEYLEFDILEIDPFQDLRRYGLDSVAMVSLIGLWRANGAHIDFESFGQNCTLSQLLPILRKDS